MPEIKRISVILVTFLFFSFMFVGVVDADTGTSDGISLTAGVFDKFKDWFKNNIVDWIVKGIRAAVTNFLEWLNSNVFGRVAGYIDGLQDWLRNFLMPDEMSAIFPIPLTLGFTFVIVVGGALLYASDKIPLWG